jgi:DNA-binding transcriptional regulator GbsR (MarR family)|tara:strand:+ start:1542 stop:1721 length:180 start_codon:yes stop_codon:yes gene_type:complete
MENENVNENKELKVELYDANKQIQGLSNTLGNIGGLIGLQGEELTIDNIMQKLNDLVNE